VNVSGLLRYFAGTQAWSFVIWLLFLKQQQNLEQVYIFAAENTVKRRLLVLPCIYK